MIVDSNPHLKQTLLKIFNRIPLSLRVTTGQLLCISIVHQSVSIYCASSEIRICCGNIFIFAMQSFFHSKI